MLLLVAGHVRDREPLEFAAFAAKADAIFLRQTLSHERLISLMLVEHLVDLVGGLRLRPKDVAWMRWRFVEPLGRVTVKNWATKRHVISRVAVAADRHVPPGHHELELVAARLAKDRDAVLLAIAA